MKKITRWVFPLSELIFGFWGNNLGWLGIWKCVNWRVACFMDKKDFLMWSKKYDKDYGRLVQKEQEFGARFRRNKHLTIEDLLQVVEWKFQDSEQKKKRILEAAAKNDEEAVLRVSSQVFNVPTEEDTFRINSLIMINGVSPVLASVILTFFDPKRYGIFDARVWKALLGNEPPNLYSTQNYLKFLDALRKTAAKQNLDVRTIEKACFKKSVDDAK
jgi:hypothetical protein